MAMAAGDSLLSQPQSITVPDGTGSVLLTETLESFKLEKQLGEGSFGTVWKAYHPIYNDVALKILKTNSLVEAQEEAVRLRKLCVYPKLIQVHCMTSSKDQKQFGIVMELMEFGNLKDFQDQPEIQQIGGIPWPIRMKMLKEISEGMYDLHHRQHPAIVHGDLKAENIFVDQSFNVKIGDLGLSRSMESIKKRSVGQGTPTHMPPEYFNCEESPNTKWDVYSFAIVLYEIGTGKHVYKELNGDYSRLEYFITVKDQRPSPKHLHSECPGVIKELMEECWIKDQDKRPAFEGIKQRISELYKKRFEQHFQSAVSKCSSQFSTNVTEVDNRAVKNEASSNAIVPPSVDTATTSSTVDQANGSSAVVSDNSTAIPTNQHTLVDDHFESSEIIPETVADVTAIPEKSSNKNPKNDPEMFTSIKSNPTQSSGSIFGIMTLQSSPPMRENLKECTTAEQNSTLTNSQQLIIDSSGYLRSRDKLQITKEFSGDYGYGVPPVSDVSSFAAEDSIDLSCKNSNDKLKTVTPISSHHYYSNQEANFHQRVRPADFQTRHPTQIHDQNDNYPSSGNKERVVHHQTGTTTGGTATTSGTATMDGTATTGGTVTRNSKYDHRKIDYTVTRFFQKKLLPEHFENLGREFKLTGVDIATIKEDIRYYPDRVNELIEKWRQINGTVTIGDIVKCVHELGLNGLINDLYEYLHSKNF